MFRGFLSLYIVLIYVLIYSAAQLQECLINLLTYLRTDVNERTTPDGMARFLPVTSMYRLLCIGLNKTKRYLIHTVTHRFMLIHTKLFKNYRNKNLCTKTNTHQQPAKSQFHEAICPQVWTPNRYSLRVYRIPTKQFVNTYVIFSEISIA